MSKIIETIEKLRNAPFNLSQSDIAQRIGMSQSRVSRWQAGELPAGVEGAIKLMDLEKKLSAKQSRKAAA